MNSVFRRRDFNRLAVGLFALGLSSHAVGTAKSANILVVGDSLSAEYGIARGTGWVALLNKQLAKDKPQWQVVNASISGDNF